MIEQLWRRSIYRMAIWLLVAVAVGGMSGYFWPALATTALGVLAWHVYNIHRLLRCLRYSRGPVQMPAPERASLHGFWRELYWDYYRLRQRNLKHKRKRSRLLRQFREAATSLPDAAVVLDDGDALRWYNRNAVELFGLGERDLGQPITTIVRNPNFLDYLQRRDYNETLQLPSPNNPERLLSLRLTTYGKKQHLLLATDISRIRRLEQMRQDFAANVSHELRTPLTVIDGYLEMLLDARDDILPVWVRPLEQMRQQSQRMLHIIQDLLLISRLETEQRAMPNHCINVSDLLKQIVADALQLGAESGHDITLELTSQQGLLGVEAELRSAFSNLVFNAIRHTPPRTQIVVRWASTSQGEGVFCVCDNGEGIAPEHLPRLTERFYRVDRARSRERGGTGLGLSIVKHVLAGHQAHFDIQSELGCGSQFCCRFPAVRLAPIAAADQRVTVDSIT